MHHELLKKMKLMFGKQVVDPRLSHLKEARRTLLDSTLCDLTVVQLFES